MDLHLPPGVPQHPPYFLNLDGPEGGGKTTQAARIRDWFDDNELGLMNLREPGGTLLGEKVRATVLDATENPMTPRAEALLFLASRAELVSTVIEPSLARGHSVLTDRFHISTLAYQGYGRGIPLDDLRGVNAFATAGRLPDVTLYLDVPTEVGFQRQLLMGKKADRMEQETLDFHERVREGYRSILQQGRDRIMRIDAVPSADEVFARGIEPILERLYAPVLKR